MRIGKSVWTRRVFGRRRVYSELAEEMRLHLEERVEELVASGVSRGDAEAAARREFGNLSLVERDGREVWRWRMMEELGGDIRYGLRMLSKTPGFTAIAVLILALGMGSNAAVFSLIDALLLRSLAVPAAQELVQISFGPAGVGAAVGADV